MSAATGNLPPSVGEDVKASTCRHAERGKTLLEGVAPLP
jgi:hypothetical protein